MISQVHANKEEGTATFYDLRYGTYYVKELEAPIGYKQSEEVIEIIIDDKLEEVGNVCSFIYSNTLLPVETLGDEPPITSDQMNFYNYLLVGAISFIVLRLINRKNG